TPAPRHLGRRAEGGAAARAPRRARTGARAAGLRAGGPRLPTTHHARPRTGWRAARRARALRRAGGIGRLHRRPPRAEPGPDAQRARARRRPLRADRRRAAGVSPFTMTGTTGTPR